VVALANISDPGISGWCQEGCPAIQKFVPVTACDAGGSLLTQVHLENDQWSVYVCIWICHCSGILHPVDTVQRPNSITLSSSQAGLRACLWPASELDRTMEFGLSGAIQLAGWSQTMCKPVCDQVQPISTCQDSSNLSATGWKPGLQLARELVADG